MLEATNKTTPRPWRLTDTAIVSDAAYLVEPNETDGEPGVPIEIINLTGACSGESGDIPLIVTAVNAHDALVAVAQYADEQIDIDSPQFKDAGDSEPVTIEVSLRWFRMVRAALKLAER